MACRIAWQDQHLTSTHSMDNYYASKLLPLIAEARVAVIANPLINILIQGRHDTYPKRRGMTRIPEMREYGILSHSGTIASWTHGTHSVRPTC